MRNKYKVWFKIPKQIHLKMLGDLRRSHSFAYERVGFLFTTSKLLSDNTILVLAKDYSPVDDKNYIDDNKVGAKINSTAIRNAMQRVMENNEGCFHVHLHNHTGATYPSRTDEVGLPPVAKSFANVSPNQASGILILSEDSFYASVICPNEKKFITPELISVVGYPLNLCFPGAKMNARRKSLDRQSFLGVKSQHVFENIKVGIIGYGGGGSHIGQQLAHLGVKNILIFDDDKVEETNLNRLIGAWFSDVKKAVLKINVAKRIIKKILPSVQIVCINKRWQEKAELLQLCDVVFGSADTYAERQQLEAECRRYLIPLIDIGMDVHILDNAYEMSGQIILSMPGSPCMKCFGFLTDKKLALEAAKYGDVGGRPQVVWANGVLASTAVGAFVDLATGWTKTEDKLIYLSYGGNKGTLGNHIRLEYAEKICTHYTFDQLGVPVFKKF